MSVKRKVSEENREFNSTWEERYFFANSNGKPQCLVCLQVISVPKEFNLKRHYSTMHEKKYGQYHGTSREAILKELKGNYSKQKKMIIGFSKPDSTADLKASYEVALTLAKHGKAFRDGEIVKECAIKMALSFGDKKIAKKFENVSLSHQTVARRVAELSENVTVQLKDVVQQCKYFSLALDESTDISNVSQLLVFIRTIDKNFTVFEELLKISPLRGTTKGIDIYNSLASVVDAYGGFEKCACVVTDGARAMTGRKRGLVGILKDHGVNCPTLHCIIHQEALCAKVLQMSDVMLSVTNIVNIIKGGNRAQRHRKFIQFLKDVGAEYEDVPLFSKIRWLSAGKTLKHFFSLRKEILNFLQNEIEGTTETYQIQLSDDKFIGSLAFLTDISNHFNILNMKLQGKKQNISQLVGHIEGFRKKLVLFKASLQRNDATHFPACSEVLGERKSIDFSAFSNKIGDIIDEFNDRFADFDLLKAQMELFNNPMEIVIESQPSYVQQELCELQSDPFLLSRKNERYDAFWRLLSNEQFPRLNDFALKICSMFGSTYICESTFSIMKRLKSDTRNRMADETLDACLRLSTTEFKAEIDTICKSKNAESQAEIKK
ncbi:general transcription factor II-I repeat domain-containing protein 2-like [Clavelina lepadiformis]|uniref:general transcription factor II-I repeat domain-containing protein 2-like n=1 Tax=Clavelina lepadiformis TaxID=159417 RepID=UPI004042822A